MEKELPDYPRGLTFEQVWASIQAMREEAAIRSAEADRRSKELDRKIDRQIEEARRNEEAARLRSEELDRQMKETDRQMKETDRQIKETDRQIKEYNKRFGDFSNRFGEIVEYMVAPNLRKKFREIGLTFPRANTNFEVEDPDNDIYLEADVILENGDKVMLVETKTKPTTKDVKYHIKRLEKMRKYADLHGDKRKYLGAVAGVVMAKNVRQYILQQGLFAVEPSGETFNITAPDGKPREW
jgi:hypothetical protein